MLINNLYPIEVYDGLVPQKSYQLIWDYLAKQTWHMKWQAISEIPAHLHRYKPTEGRTAGSEQNQDFQILPHFIELVYLVTNRDLKRNIH